MDEKEKMQKVEALADQDELYQYMMEKLRIYQEELDSACAEMPSETRNLIWDFIMLSEDMSTRKLRLACRNMEFRE